MPHHPADGESYTDFIQPFLIDHSAIRGRLVRLDAVIDTILRAHDYPRILSRHLGEQIVLAALLSATLSGDGILTVQARGDGPVRFTVVDVLAGGIIRGYADADSRALAAFKGKRKVKIRDLMGKGHLAVTLDPGESAERYQGIVELTGDSMSDVFRGYFLQSQQAEIAIHVTVRPPDKTHKNWRAGGIIIERMPLEGGHESESTPAEQDELWTRTQLFMKTLKDEELLDPAITPQNLLYRLFGEDGVWVYKLQPLHSGCRCSRERVETVLHSVPEPELLSMLEDDKITIHCQFCNKREIFTRDDLKRLYAPPLSPDSL